MRLCMEHIRYLAWHVVGTQLKKGYDDGDAGNNGDGDGVVAVTAMARIMTFNPLKVKC